MRLHGTSALMRVRLARRHPCDLPGRGRVLAERGRCMPPGTRSPARSKADNPERITVVPDDGNLHILRCNQSLLFSLVTFRATCATCGSSPSTHERVGVTDVATVTPGL